MDIGIIVVHLPACKTWQDVARLVKANLNPRDIVGTPRPGKWFEWSTTFENAVLASEIVAFFILAGFEEEEAERITYALIQMGHFEIVGYTHSDDPNPRMPIVQFR